MTDINDAIGKIIIEEIEREESSFRFPELLAKKYFKKYRENYIDQAKADNVPPFRNYICLMRYLNDIASYNKEHAQSYVKKFELDSNDWKSGEATFAEVIVYQHYINMVHEGLLKKIDLIKGEADLILEKADGEKTYLEIFSIMPSVEPPSDNAKYATQQEVTDHTKDAPSSIRENLYGKIKKRRQLNDPKEHYAVIELNDPLVTGDSIILSSLFGGFKIHINKNTAASPHSGYSRSNSVFEDEETKFTKGIIYFDQGNYAGRKVRLNPNFGNIENE